MSKFSTPKNILQFKVMKAKQLLSVLFLTCTLSAEINSTQVVQNKYIDPVARLLAIKKWAAEHHEENVQLSHYVASGRFSTANLSTSLLQSSAEEVRSVSAQCRNDVRATLSSAAVIQFLDAWGRPTPGVLDGSLKWLGSYEQCMSLELPLSNSNGTTAGSQVAKYCNIIIGFQQPDPVFPIILGVCYPNSCLEEDIESYFHNITSLLFLKVVDVQCQPTTEESVQLDSDAIVMICVLSVLGLLIVLGTVYDVIIQHNEKSCEDKTPHKMSLPTQSSDCGKRDENTNNNNNLEDSGNVISLGQMYQSNEKHGSSDVVCTSIRKMSNTNGATNDVEIFYVDENSSANGVTSVSVTSSDEVAAKTTSQKHAANQGFSVFDLLLPFSVYTNGRRILSTGGSKTKQQTELQAIHGIRFLSMCWVILGHTYSQTFQYSSYFSIVQNAFQRYESVYSFSKQALLGGTLSVDTFFLLSGTLVAYLTLREMRSREGPKHVNWALYYFHRFWRLTPPYMLIMATYLTLFTYMGEGPVWPEAGSSPDPYCKESWWTNLLYINNLVNTDKMCFGVSWYLANDMQFFVIAPIMLIPLYLSGVLGVVVVGVLMVASFIATGIISSTNHYLPYMHGGFSPLASDPVYANYSQAGSFEDLYIPPYTRIGPYLIGILLGYILFKTNRTVKMHWTWVCVGWIFAVVLGMTVVYGPYWLINGDVWMSVEFSALYNTTHRTVWAVAVAWVIFACVTGYGGFVNTILSWSGLVPLSRLTYMAYLVHCIVILHYVSTARQTLICIDETWTFMFLGYLLMSYMAAFVLSLAFESPMMALEKVIFKRQRRK